MHLDKYLKLGEFFPVDDIAMCKERVMRMQPVDRYRVMAVGYRR